MAERPAWAGSLGATLDEVWRRLARGVADRRAPARHPVLATVGLRAFAEARVVVLRGADRGAARLEIHTDGAAGKVAELAGEPGATLLVWEPQARLQIRLRAVIRPGTAQATAAAWARVPEPARAQYRSVPPPGAPVPGPGATAEGPPRFTLLAAEVQEIETLHLGEPQARALFAAEDGWAGRWLAP